MATFDTNADGACVFGLTSITTAACTVSSSANRAGTLGVYHDANNKTGITTTIAGQSGALVTGSDSGTSNTRRVFTHAAVALSTGSQTATCSWTGGTDAYSKLATWTNCDQTTPAINGATAQDPSSNAPTLALAAGGDASVCFCAGILSGNNKTLVGSQLTGTSMNYQAQRDTAGGTTFTWANSFNAWVASGCNLQSPAAGGSAMNAAGAGVLTMTGASTAAAAMSAAGAGAMTMTGAAGAAGVLSAAGAGTMTMTGAAIATGVLNAAGSGVASFVGADGTNYATGAWASAGAGVMTMTGASIAAGAMSAAGSSTADFRAVPEVAPAAAVTETNPGPGGGVKDSGHSWAEAERRRRMREQRRRDMLIAAVKGIAPAVFAAMSRPGYIHIINRTLH